MKNYRIKHFGLGLVFIISFFQNFQAQTFDWAKSQGGTSSDIALDVVTDAAGNVYTVGYFSGTVDFDPSGVTQNLVSAGAQDIFVSKLNATGALVWVLRFGAANNDVANGIALDPSGNILITGWFNSIVDFDPGAGVVTLNNTSGSDIYVLKLTANGNFVWVKQFGGNVENQVGNKITTDAAGNVYSTGQSKAVIDFDPGPGTANLGVAGTSPSFYVSKLDVNGNYVWAKVMGTSGSLAYGLDIEVSSVGEVYTCGYFGGTIDFDPGAGTYSQTSSTNNGFVHKLDVNGNYVWAKTVGGASNNSFNSIVLAQDKIFVAGYFANTGDFDPGTSVVNMTADGGADVLVESFDFNGNYVWVKKLGGAAEDWAYSISADGYGGIYTTGFFTASGDFDPGAGAATLSAVGLRDVFISKLDFYGNYHWAQQIGGTATDQGYGIHVGQTGSVHTTGYYGATGDFDHTAGISTLTNAGSNDVFTQKMSQCLTPPAPVNTTANMQTICTNSNIALSVSGFGTIGWYTDPTGGTYIGGGSSYTTPNLTATTTYYVQDSVCGPSSRTPITVTVNALPSTPTITAGGPTSICAGGSVTLTSTAGTSYLWSTGATTASINVTTAGIYSVQVNDAAGCQSSASAGTTVTVNALPGQPIITAGGPTTFCQGGSVTLSSSVGTSYLWSDGSMSASINPSSSGTYTVQVTNAAGCQSIASASTVLTVNPLPNAPIISPNAPTTFCDGGTVNLASSAGITYLWSNGSTLAAIDVTTSGTYTVQITTPSGCQSPPSAPMIVTVNPTPTIALGTIADPTSCTVDNGSIQVNGSGTGTLSWSGTTSGTLTGVTLPTTIPNLGDGSYIITFTNAISCVSNTLNSSLSAPSAPAAPSINANTSTTFCDGGSVTLTASAGTTYLWSNGATSNSIVVTDPGDYSVSITDVSGCSSASSSATTVVVNALPIIASGVLIDPQSCLVADGSIEITGSGQGDLTWNGPSSGSQLGVTLPAVEANLGQGNYTFEFTDANGCTSVPLAVNLTAPGAPAAPTISTNGPTTFCEGGMVTLTASAGTTYEWSNGETTASIDVLANGTFTVSITDASGCVSPSSSTTTVTVDQMPDLNVTMTNNVLTAVQTSANYQWIDCATGLAIAGETNQVFTPTQNGNYAVVIASGTCSDTSSCNLVSTIGIDEIDSKLTIRIQPNPTSNEVAIITTTEVERIEIYTLNGDIVQTEQTTAFSVSHLATGVYLVKVYTTEGLFVERLVKN
jgi:hypothetical protein